MSEMSWPAKFFCTSRVYRAFARRILVPWGLQGVRLRGDALEIGSGSGAMAAEFLSLFPELRVIATDYDSEMVEIARRTLAPFGSRASVQRADASNLPFGDSQFDFVLSFAMLHHVGDWKKTIGQAVRVLRPGGRLIGYDLLDAMPFRLHGGVSHGATMLRPDQLDEVLRNLPVASFQSRRGVAGVVLRFIVTKNAGALAAS
jgi:ubiquinone/menaquinone biosynthesis C-methylase UbiE